MPQQSVGQRLVAHGLEGSSTGSACRKLRMEAGLFNGVYWLNSPTSGVTPTTAVLT